MKSREIRVIYGKDIAAMTRRLVEDYDLASKIGDVNAKIALKPNLVVATTPDTGATTHVEIITEVIEYLQENGFKNISILEGSWVGDDTERAFRVNGYHGVAAHTGTDEAVKIMGNLPHSVGAEEGHFLPDAIARRVVQGGLKRRFVNVRGDDLLYDA